MFESGKALCPPEGSFSFFLVTTQARVLPQTPKSKEATTKQSRTFKSISSGP
jgi:hypothetical protein